MTENTKIPAPWEPVYYDKSQSRERPELARLRQRINPYEMDLDLDFATLKELADPATVRQAVARTNFTKQAVYITGDDNRMEAVLLDYNAYRCLVDPARGVATKEQDEMALRKRDPRKSVL